YEGGERWTDLVEILRRRVEISEDPAEQKRQLRRVAEIYEVMLEQPGEAVAAHLEVLDHLADDLETLVELARLYREAGRHADLLEVLERRLAVLDDRGEGGEGTAIELRFTIANLLAGPLAREREALDRWAEVLTIQPDHPGALAAIEGAIDDDELREQAAEVLRPLYEATGQDDKLAGLLERLAAGTDDVRERLRHLREVASIRETRLGDRAGALATAVRAFEVAVAEPELTDVLADVERLATDLGREDELIDIYRRIAPDVLDGEIQRTLYLDVADLARAVRHDVGLAREHYQKVLDAQPDDRRALLALESIYRETGEHARLWDVLMRKSELAADPNARVAALAEAAALCAGPLDRPDEAIAGWEQVLELAPERKDAVGALEQLYRGAQRWHDLVDLYERRLGFAFTVEEAVALRLKLAALHDQELRDAEAAVENYAAALGGDPDNADAIAALERYLDDPVVRAEAAEVLEPLYVSRQQWAKLIRIYEIKLEAAGDPGDRLRLTRFIARLYEEQLEDFEGAARWYARLFRENPVDPGTRDQLQRLAMILDNWQFLAETYQGWLDDDAGEGPTVRDVALVLATVYDRRLDQIDLGAVAYRRVLDCAVDGATPDDREVLGRLEALLTRGERWPVLVEVYEEAIAAEEAPARRGDLQARMARVLEDRLSDRRRAIDAWREVMAVAADEPGLAAMWQQAALELDRLLRVEAQWYDLADLLTTRIERADGDAARADLQLALAEVLEKEQRDVNAAIDQYEAVLEGPAWERALPHLERLVVLEDHRERIAGLLEPVYRRNDWWQKLVVILDAKLAFIDDPRDKVTTLCEIAQIHDSRGGDLGMAFDALSRAWRSEPSDASVFEALTHQASRLGAWDELVEVLETGIAGTFDPEVAATVHARIAEVHETQRGDHPAAIASWRKVLEQRPDDAVALAALDRLLAVEGRAEELVAVVERRAELADDAGVRLVLLHRVASLYEEVLERPRDAVTAYRNVLAVDDADEAALDALERLFRQLGEHRDLAETLERKIELATDPAARRALRLAAAKVDEEDLGDVFEAIAQLQAILAEAPADAEALAELDRLYGREKMWPDLLEIIDRRTALAADGAAGAELAFRAARLVEQELLEPGEAIARYGAILQTTRGHAGARAALEALLASDEHVDPAGAILERLYRDAGDAAALVALYERRLAVPGDPEERRGQWAQLAEIHEILRGDLAEASRTWARALAETPDDLGLFAPLERLAHDRGAWPELAGVLDERLRALGDPQLELAYATRLGQIQEEAIGDLDAAADAYRRALAVADDEREPLAALDRVLVRAGKWAELGDVLVREADAVGDDAAAADFLFRLGDARETSLGDVAGAIEAYRDALERAPQHRAARGSLERLLATADEHRAAIIDVLEPLYEADGDWARLADLLTARLSVVEDHLDRAALYQRIAELSEQQLRDPVRALDAAGGWLAEDPASGEALAEVERQAAALGRWGEVAARLGGIVGNADLDPDVRLSLTLRLGVVQLDRIGDVAGAARTFGAALELDAECQPALEALERVHRGVGDTRALAEVLTRRGELAYEPAAKRAAYAEVADLRERMGEHELAIAAWKTVLELDEGDREALARLAALHQRAGEHRALVEVLEQTARFAVDGGEEKQLRIQIARLEGDVLRDRDRAVAAWQAVLDLDPDEVGALEALEALHTTAGDWLAVQDVLTRRLDLAAGSADRIAILARMAQVAEQRRGALDDAIGHWFTVLELDNAHAAAYDQLERLLAKGERWHDLVELLERRAEVEGTLGRNDDEIRTLARAADIWEGPLDSPDAAGDILEKILAREPGSVTALTRLAKIYERSSDWDKCGEVLQRALALGPRGRDAADLFYRLGEVAAKASGDLETAQAHWRQALGHDATHAPTIAALERLARERQDWATLADLLGRREATLPDGDDRLALVLELADLHRKLGQPAAAVPLLVRAAEHAPDDVRVLAPLADLYFAAGELDRAAPIYDRLAEEAKAKRQMKDVARYRQRQGGILEARGDGPGAMAAYEEAFRVNPTDVPTMAGLGRLYMAARDWEKARRVYRSLVLQNVDADAGLTKADVYYALGVIHVELNEAPKARGMFQRGLEVDPHDERLKDALARLA
ncbi:MAG: tetratricopeptide repeat protein, partial [Kofleriaceae bacterium]|nr:tetratricopeptide repeat protein [Kofleriaceae bacterium]